MKKSIINLFALVCATLALASCGTARLAMNTTYKGDKLLLTNDIKLFRNVNGGRVMAALGVKCSQKDTIMAVLVTFDGDHDHGAFDIGDKFQVRLSNGREISLNNMYDREYENHTETNTTTRMVNDFTYAYNYNPWIDAVYLSPVTVSRWVPEVYTTKVTKSYALYPITYDQLVSIVEKGVDKLRIESNVGDMNMPDTKNVSEIFKSFAECLIGELAKNKESGKF